MKNGFRVMDSDIHCNEPGDLWLRYVEPAFRDRAPRPTTADEPGDFVVMDRAVPAHFDRPERQENFGIRQERARQRFADLGRTDAVPGEGGIPDRMLQAM